MLLGVKNKWGLIEDGGDVPTLFAKGQGENLILLRRGCAAPNYR